MSITSTVPVNIVPIYRGDITKVKSPEIIARWNSSSFVTGDGSGGTMTCQVMFAIGAIPFMYGSYALLDLQTFSYEASVAPTWVNLRISLLEPSSPVIGFANEWSLNAGTMMAMERMILPKYKYSVGPSALATIELIANNVNATVLYFRCAGMVYDGRIL